MKALLIILSGLVASWYFTDLASDSGFRSILAPLGIFLFLIAAAIWLVGYFQKSGINQRTKHGGGGSDFFGGDGGGDC